jgi:PAS domain-containing protein
MHAIVATPDELLETAIAAARLYEVDALDHLPAAIYTTNAEGRITYFNRACVDFSGRTPRWAGIAGAFRGSCSPRTANISPTINARWR